MIEIIIAIWINNEHCVMYKVVVGSYTIRDSISTLYSDYDKVSRNIKCNVSCINSLYVI